MYAETQVEEQVYVIASSGSKVVKIGRSKHVQTRLAQLQLSCPARLAVLWCTAGGAELEKALHEWFSEHRTHGEWFDLSNHQDPVIAVRNAAAAITASRPRRCERLAGFIRGEVVRILVDDWPYTSTGVIKEIFAGSEFPFLVAENDGRRHCDLVAFGLAQIAHQREVPALPTGAYCFGEDCACQPEVD